MMEFEKAQLISAERDGLRQEIITLDRAMHRSIFVFFTGLVAIMGMYFGRGVISEHNRAVLILVASQGEILLGLFMGSLLCNQNVHVGYIRVLEDKLNKLAKENINIWETAVTQKWLAAPTSCFFVSCFMQVVAYAMVFVVLVYFAFEVTCHVIWGVAFAGEVAATLGILVWSMFEPKRVERFAKERMGGESTSK